MTDSRLVISARARTVLASVGDLFLNIDLDGGDSLYSTLANSELVIALLIINGIVDTVLVIA